MNIKEILIVLLVMIWTAVYGLIQLPPIIYP